MTNPCIETLTRKIIVFPDKHSKSEFKIRNDNERKIEKHKVDGCLIKGEEFKKCDWLAVDVESKKEIFIELKGKDIEHAVKQLCSSVEKLSKDKKAKKLGYVICTRSPLTSPEIQKKAKEALRSHQLILRIKPNHTETIEKLIADLN